MNIGDYTIQIKGSLGTGGQGSVFKGRNNKTGEKVAIKVIDLSTTENRKAFESEFQALSVKSKYIKNVVEILGTFQNEKSGFVVMKRYDCDLFTVAFEERDNALLPELVVKELFRKICNGVKYLHREGVAHLDIKPENILIDRNTMEPYICDFGNAFTSCCKKKKDRSNSISVPALGYRGTRRYSSPEMDFSPFFYDPFKADIYSLGITLYNLLVGSYPTENIDGSINLDGFAASHSNDCVNLLQRLLNSDPNERISVEEILKHPYLTPIKVSFLAKKLAMLKKSAAKKIES